MKRIITFLAIASAALLLGSCAKENFENGAASVCTKLVLDLPSEKTFLGELAGGKRPLYWSEGDSVAVNGEVSDPLPASADSTKSAVFTFEGKLLSYPYNIAYPASIWTSGTQVTLPALTKYIPLIGYQASEGSATVNYVTSVLHFKLVAGTSDEHKVSYVEVKAAGVQMNGVFNVDFENGTITSAETASADNNYVRRYVKAALGTEAVDVFVPVPAGTYAATVKVVDSYGHYMEKTITSRTFTKGTIHAFPAFAFEPTGTVVDVVINDADGWNTFATNFNNGVYEDVSPLVVSINGDLDFAGKTPVMAGSYVGDHYCPAVIIGGGHKISNYVSGNSLLGAIDTNGSVSDLEFDATCSFAPDFSAGVKNAFGPYCEYLKGELKNCINRGAITINQPTSGAITADKYCGGLAGRIREGKMIDCKNYGTITSNAAFACTAEAKKGLYAGGMVGWISNADGVVKNCENHGAITHNATADPLAGGGIAGKCTGTVFGCVNDANLVVNTNRVTSDPCKNIYFGGIAGECAGAAIDSCANTGTLTSESNVKIQDFGGTVGILTAASTIGNNTNAGDIIANKSGRIYYFGGLIGNVMAAGTNAFTFTGTPNTGKIAVNAMEAGTAVYLYLGGLVGRTSQPITIKGVDLEVNCDITFNASTAARQAPIAAVGGVLGGTHTEGATLTIEDCDVIGNGIIITAATSIANKLADAGFGGILGNSGVGAVIRNCNVDIPVKFADDTRDATSNGTIIDFGGIAGRIYGGDSEISNCTVGTKGIRNYHYNNNAVSTTTGNATGGVIGSFGHVDANSYSITISNCTNASKIYAYRCCGGGIAGFLDHATVTNCSTTGAITNANYGGGIVGYAANSSFTGCTFNNADGIVTTNAGSTLNYAGGLAGQTVKTSFTSCKTYFGTTNGVKAAGAVNKGNAPGAFIGNSDANSDIITCSAGGKLQSAIYGMADGSAGPVTLDDTSVVTLAIGNNAFTVTAANATLWDGK